MPPPRPAEVLPDTVVLLMMAWTPGPAELAYSNIAPPKPVPIAPGGLFSLVPPAPPLTLLPFNVLPITVT